MARRRFNQAQVDQFREAYEKWSALMYSVDGVTIDQLCEQLGVAKQTLYKFRRQGWTIDAATAPAGPTAAIARLETEVHELQMKNAELMLAVDGNTRRLERLEARARVDTTSFSQPLRRPASCA